MDPNNELSTPSGVVLGMMTITILIQVTGAGRVVPHLQTALRAAGCAVGVKYGFSVWRQGGPNDVIRARLGAANVVGELRLVVLSGPLTLVVQGVSVVLSLLGGDIRSRMMESQTIWLFVGDGRLREADGGITLVRPRALMEGLGLPQSALAWECLRGPNGMNRDVDLQGIAPQQFATPVVRMVGCVPLLILAVQKLSVRVGAETCFPRWSLSVPVSSRPDRSACGFVKLSATQTGTKRSLAWRRPLQRTSIRCGEC